MGHHTSEHAFSSENLDEVEHLFAAKREHSLALELEAMQQKLGATGKFPEGKICAHDEGELRMSIGEMNGAVTMNFGKPIASLGFTKQQAYDLAESLMAAADRLGA